MTDKTKRLTVFLAAALLCNIVLVAVCQYLVIFRMPQEVTDRILERKYPQFEKCQVLQQQMGENLMFLLVEDQLGDHHILTFEKMYGLPRYRYVQSNKAWDCEDANDNPVPFRPYEAQVNVGGNQIDIGLDGDMQMWHSGTLEVTAAQLTQLYLLACPALLAVELALYFLRRKLGK